MSEDSPRWPGTQGGPGLDFSPYRKPEPEGDAAEVKAEDESAAEQTVIASPATPASPASPSEARTRSDAHSRAADTARAWASTPVGGTPVVPAREADPGVAASGDASAPGLKTEIIDVTANKEGDGDAVVTPAKRRAARRTRKARLRLSRIDPWSVMKTTFLFAIAIGVMMCAIVFVLWSVLAGSGALESANQLINQVVGDANNQFDITTYLDIRRVMGFTMMIAFVDVLILTAVATLFAFLYNLSAVVLGGLEVTLAED